VTQQRGEFFAQPEGHLITATVHPSSILRAPDAATRETELAAFTDDLRQVAKKLA
jgi:DNA polymerase